MIKTKKQMYLVIGAFALVLMLGTVTYAFFNYTRTGSANTIRVGRIAFNTSQASGQDGAINLSNAFPITRTLAATDNTNAGEVVITITGDTSYSGGVEYLVTATDVSNTVNSKTVPISIIATISNGLGSSDDSYFTNRGGNSSIYKVLANETISNNDQLLVGYIAPDNNQTGVNGTITIRAYLDSDLVVISDTYNNGNTPTDNLGTPASFGENKTVLTTSEWNSLRTSGVSFKVKVEANEGTWVEEPLPDYAVPTCPGCKFVFPHAGYYYKGENVSTESDFDGPHMEYDGDMLYYRYRDVLYDDYRELVTNTKMGIFIGLKFDGNRTISNAYACGLVSGMSLADYIEYDFSQARVLCIDVERILDDSTYSEYSSTLANDDACSVDEYGVSCGQSGYTELSVSNDVESSGYRTINTYLGDSFGCDINISGDYSFDCY